MKRVQLIQSGIAFVDDDDYERINRHKWRISNKGYAQRTYLHKAVMMHREILGLVWKDGLEVDHINGNKLDNRKSNLRICTPSQNLANQRLHKKSRSGLKGVSWGKSNNKWQAQITHHKKHYHLGYFDDPIEAAKVYDNKALELFGEFAKINFSQRD